MSCTCRACGSRDLFEVLDLGLMPLAGDFRPRGAANELYPLAIDGCATCAVLQVRQTVDRSILFHPHYSYASSTVPGLVRHFNDFAGRVALPQSAPAKLLLEVGCNDGVFLTPLGRVGYRVVGIDASDNVARMARAKGLDVHTGLFSPSAARALVGQYGPFDVVTCSNVFAHNPEVTEFLEAVDLLLDQRGEFWVEVHSAQRLYSGLQWDCFYHEHCFYWTVRALAALLARYGYKLKSYETTPMHGGALRAVFSRSVVATAIEETRLTPEDWMRFGRACQRSRDLIRSCFDHLPLRYAFGAAGRAVVLINWTGIASQLEFAVDGSPLRFGKAIPNTRVPIISEADFFATPGLNEWCFVTAHNYLDDIRRKVEQRFPETLIRFVTPLPHVQVQ